MFILVIFATTLAIASAAPGYPDFSYGHSDLYHGSPAPIYESHAPVIAPAPIYSHPPIYKSIVPAPTYIKAIAPAPILKVAPVLKTYATPVVKSYAPATSYASVTTYQVSHPAPVVKAIVAQPVIKSIVQAQPSYISVPSYGHGYSGHDYSGHDYHGYH